MEPIDYRQLLKRLDEIILRHEQYIDRAKHTPGGYLDTLKYDLETLRMASAFVAGAAAILK